MISNILFYKRKKIVFDILEHLHIYKRSGLCSCFSTYHIHYGFNKLFCFIAMELIHIWLNNNRRLNVLPCCTPLRTESSSLEYLNTICGVTNKQELHYRIRLLKIFQGK